MPDPVIVTKVNREFTPTSFKITPYKKVRVGERLDFEINVIAEAQDNLKKRAIVKPNIPTWSAFKILCDEGIALGGEDTAPSPLCYFSAGIALCLLTHLTLFIKAKNLQIDQLRIEQRTTFATDAEKSAETVGTCDGVETHILVESSEPEDEIKYLASISEQACMAMQTIVNPIPQVNHVHLNGKKIAWHLSNQGASTAI
ncbi:MAG: OsmC-related (seleno)protein [Gammaproteobacteria bacterium]